MRSRATMAAILGFLGALLFGGCEKTGIKSYTVPGNSLHQERAEKDAAYRIDRDSPIPPQDRAQFQGLRYYPVRQSFRFRTKLTRHPNPEPVRLGTNTGEIRVGKRYGYVEFVIGGQNCRLQVYQLDDGTKDGIRSHLFIPFRDATSGKESYGAGRYLDVTEDPSGLLDLDFNRAYNPSCAYGSNFSCPLPPAENTLRAAVEAGEKAYH